MRLDSILPTIASAVLGGGTVGAYVSFRKLKPESDQIVVSAAKDVVVIQRGLVDDLRHQMEELDARFSERLDKAEQARWTAETALAECHRTRAALQEDYEQEKARNAELEERIAALEAEVAKLRDESTQRHPKETP